MYDLCYIQPRPNVQGVSPGENFSKRQMLWLNSRVLSYRELFSRQQHGVTLTLYHRVFCFVYLFDKHHFLGPPPQFHSSTGTSFYFYKSRITSGVNRKQCFNGIELKVVFHESIILSDGAVCIIFPFHFLPLAPCLPLSYLIDELYSLQHWFH